MSTATGGLSRRRVGGGDQSESSSGNTNSNAGPSELKTSTNGSTSTGGTRSTGATNAGNNGQSSPTLNSRSSHKVGYDPRDMDGQDEERTNPKLTLMEEVLLMGLKDKQVPFSPSSPIMLDILIHVALITGLSILLERQYFIYFERSHHNRISTKASNSYGQRSQ